MSWLEADYLYFYLSGLTLYHMYFFKSNFNNKTTHNFDNQHTFPNIEINLKP